MKIFKPGKVFAFGEYAVVKGYSSIILKTHRGLYFDIKPSNLFQVKSSHINYTHQLYKQPQTKVEKAVHQALSYLDSIHTPHQPCQIIITSDLEKDTISYGLGSSGAFVVGVIEAILKWHHIAYTKALIFKLAVLSHRDDFHLTSYGDYAVSAYDSHIYYKKMDAIPSGSLVDLLIEDWPRLEIKEVEMPFDWTLINVHQKTSSHNLVNQVFQHDQEITPFLKTIDKTTEHAYQSIRTHNRTDFYNHIQNAQETFEELALLTQAPIMVSDYQTLIEVAKSYNVYCKISGAGGGDNLICFGEKENLVTLKHSINDQYFVFEGVNHES